jgi:hypothetical protein
MPAKKSAKRSAKKSAKTAKKSAQKTSTKKAAKKAAAPKTVAKKKASSKSTLKTQETKVSAAAYLAQLPDDVRADCQRLDAWMSAATGEPGVMWGSSIVGYGHRVLRYDSGRELDWMKIAFAPRKGTLTLYLLDGFSDYAAQLKRLGKHKTGKSCLYIKRLADVDVGVLQEMIRASVDHATV